MMTKSDAVHGKRKIAGSESSTAIVPQPSRRQGRRRRVDEWDMASYLAVDVTACHLPRPLLKGMSER
ncbi:hypothetical protein GCM10022280_20060 [Sphingomonas swuensis]|uniref:Uncharacterized protein n=1 Tax=Sphingomonas swuensis TaxID=977800 RepID=A0ABP7T2A6_9SPHN